MAEQSTPRLRRILFVSRDYASEFSVAVSGLHQRLHMLLEAAQLSCERLDILFFVDPALLEKIGPLPSQASLKKQWGIDAEVRLAPRAGMAHGALLQTARGLVDFRAQDGFYSMDGDAQVAAIEQAIHDDTDLIFAHRLYIASAVVRARTDVPIVLDLDDIEHRKRSSVAQALPMRLSTVVARLEAWAMKRGELATMRKCRVAFTCSEGDREYLATKAVSNTAVVPNAARFADLPASAPAAGQVPTLFFIGTYGYEPNAVAAEYLVNLVFPIVLRKRPDARLLIVGRSVELLPSHSARPHAVEFLGFVPDLADVYRRASVVCCPILSGGGTRVKILEAAAARKAIVSTTVGAEGLELIDGLEILIRDTPDAFAEACIALLGDRARADALGAAAHDKVKLLYERSQVVDSIARLLTSLGHAGG